MPAITGITTSQMVFLIFVIRFVNVAHSGRLLVGTKISAAKYPRLTGCPWRRGNQEILRPTGRNKFILFVVILNNYADGFRSLCLIAHDQRNLLPRTDHHGHETLLLSRFLFRAFSGDDIYARSNAKVGACYDW